MQIWLPWEIVSNHLGQELKHHKSILNDDLMHLSIENMKYRIFKIYVAMRNGCYGDFATVLEFRAYNANCG